MKAITTAEMMIYYFLRAKIGDIRKCVIWCYLKDAVPMVITGEYFSRGVDAINNFRRY